MKFIGFVLKHGKDSFAKDLKQYYLKNNIENEHRKKIVEYLKKGILCVPFMGIAEDEDGTRMGHIAVYTDGEWLWPEYFINYIERYHIFFIDTEFTNHVLKNFHNKIDLTEEEILKAEKFFYKNWE